MVKIFFFQKKPKTHLKKKKKNLFIFALIAGPNPKGDFFWGRGTPL